MPVNRLIVIGFILVLAGAVIPFLMVVGVLPKPLWLSMFAYGSSIAGLLLGLLGASSVYKIRRSRREDDSEGMGR